MRMRSALPAACGAATVATVMMAALAPARAAEVTAEPFGRIHFDAMTADDGVTELGSGTEFRRARIGLKGNVADDWSYKAEYDFADGDAAFKDVYLAYTGWTGGEILFGNFKTGFSLEEETSSNYITFMERALPVEAFATSRRLGAGVRGGSGPLTYAATVYGQENDVDGNNEDEGWGIGGRVTYGVQFGRRGLFHVGGSAAREEPETTETDEFRIRARPEAHLTSRRLVDATVPDASSITKYGVEAALVTGPFSLQGEYVWADVDASVGADPTFSGWYGYASWFLSGESRAYKGGKFDRVKTRGGWELAARFSTLDLNDSGFTGGEQEDVTLGLNYYHSSHLRFMLNYVMVTADPSSAGIEDEPDILQGRVQVDW